jgi:hypothetical protein
MMKHDVLYSYLIGVQAIDQNSFPEVLAKSLFTMQSVPINTDVVSWNLDQSEMYNIM